MYPTRDGGARRPLQRRLFAARLVGALLVALGLAWVVLHTAVDRAPLRGRIRTRAGEALHARLPDALLGEEVRIDWLFRAEVGPITVPASARGAPPVLLVERLRVRLALWPLLAGRIEPASVRVTGVRLELGPGGQELLSLVARLRAARPPREAKAEVASRHGADLAIRLSDLWIAVALGRRTLEIGPLDLAVLRAIGEASDALDATLRLPGGGRFTARLVRTVPGGQAAAAATGGPLPRPGASRPPDGVPPLAAWTLAGSLEGSPADLPAPLRSLSISPTAGRLTGTLTASGDEAGATATLRAALDGLTLTGPAAGPAPLGPFTASGEATLELNRRDGRVVLRDATWRPTGPAVVELGGSLGLSGEQPLELTARLAPVSLRDAVAALPEPLQPATPELPLPDGPVSGRWRVAGPLRRPAEWVVEGDLDLAGLREAARRAPPSSLRGTLTAHPNGPEGPAVVVGAERPGFVPYGELPEHVVRAITTSEDAGFFGHHGFDFGELKNAAAAAGQAGRLGRGGSTITQQLAKNLFLSRERTVARKVKEALLTVALEGSLPKARLFEIYVNLIEWGPGLHGIGPAARTYFGKDARALTPREACFLAAAIPSPLRTYAAVAGGTPPDRWAARIDDLLGKLAFYGVLDEGALEAARTAPLVFAAGLQPASAAEAAAAAAEGAEPSEADPADAADPPPPPAGPTAGGPPR